MAGTQGGDQQAEVREDWREEAEHAHQGACRGFPRYAAAASLDRGQDLTSALVPAEEFAIYLNYVRKLGFEETPDYDFLRELFTKVLKNSGEPEDGVYDWMMLNNGKGWEASTVRSHRLCAPLPFS